MNCWTWIKDNKSDIIAFFSLVVSAYLAISANHIAKKANEMTNRTSIIRLENFGVELINPGPESIVRISNEELLSGTSVKLSGKISIDYGVLSKLYLVSCDVIDDHLEIQEINIKEEANSNKSFYIEQLVGIQQKGNMDRINQHFYLIGVDESHRIHRMMVEVTAKSSYLSTPTGDGKTGNLEVRSADINSEEIFYRSFNDYELIQYRILQSSSNWNGIDKQNENKYYNAPNVEDILTEVEGINKYFATYGFN